MKGNRYTKAMLTLVALLLSANLLAPLMKPGTAYAEEEEPMPPGMITGSGSIAWVLKGNMVYYLKFEQQFESIRIYGPQELEE